MSVGRVSGISIKTTELSDKVKNLISSALPEPVSKISEDTVKTNIKKVKGIPINVFPSEQNPDTLVCRKPNIKDIVSPKANENSCPSVPPEDKAKFKEIYSHINKNFKERYNGKEADYALQILLNDNLRSVANDIEKTNLLKVAVYELDEVKDNPKKYKDLQKAIDNVINDFKSQGKMNKLVEFTQISISGTGTFLTGMDDFGVNKLVKNDKLLSATNPSQKSDMLYRLKFGYTGKVDEKSINKILKNAVEQNQLKSLMGYWSDGLDMTSAKMDSLYSNVSGENKIEFLKIVKTGMEKENINPKFMSELYHGDKIMEDIAKLTKAETLEKQSKYSEAGGIFTELGDTKKAKELLEKAGYENLQKGNYLSLAKNFITYTKADAKASVEYLSNSIDKVSSNHLTRTAKSFVADKMDNAFKNNPVLQAKNIMVLKEEREKNLERLKNIVPPKLTEQQKSLSHQKFEQNIDNLTGTKAQPGNKMQLLIDGEQAFEKLKSNIDNAKESIYIEVFLFQNDKKGNEIADALIKKANEGLDVRVVVDSTMNSASFKVLNKLKNSKVQFIKNKGTFASPIENRGMSAYHRKLYIFDKKTAMSGGVNVGDEYLTKGRWHDLLVEVKGPVMSDTLNDFYKHWNYSKGGDETTLEKAPPPSAFKNPVSDTPMEGSGKARLLTTDPVNGKKNIKIWMLEAIKNAKERVFIQDPYFNDPEIVGELKNAINRGVKVEVIFPNSNDVSIMKHLDDNVLDELYAAGANVYMYNTDGKESFNHLKATLVDDMVSLGSSNKDVRALNTNQEINYVFDDKKFAQTFIDRVWSKDKENCTPAEVNPETFVKRLIKLGLKQAPSFF